jgi:hypothetical protein
MRTKKVKPPPKKFEFALSISKEHDDIQKKDYISFTFNTTKEFLTFRYILNIEEDVTGNDITFNIIGFQAPTGDLSNSGYAEYEFRMYEFKYTEYCVHVHRKDVDSSKFKFKIQRSKTVPIKILSQPRNSFIEISA